MPAVHVVLSHLGGHVADTVGAITDILGGSHAAGSQCAFSKHQVYLEGTAVFVGHVTCLVIAPAILDENNSKIDDGNQEKSRTVEERKRLKAPFRMQV